MANNKHNIGPVFNGVPEQQPGQFHPTARAFFNDVAEERRIRRWVMLNLDPDSEIFQAFLSSPPPTEPSSTAKLVSLLGQSDEPRWVDSPFSQEFSQDECVAFALEDDGNVFGEGNPSRFGLNAMHAFELYWDSSATTPAAAESTKWGTYGEPYKDATRLGANVVRQLGRRDLLWGFQAPTYPVSSQGALKTSKKVTLQADLESTLEYGLDTSANQQANQSLLAQQFYFAYYESDVKFVFTFLTLGGGSDKTTTQNPISATTCSYDSSSVEYTNSALGAEIDWNGSIGSFIELNWNDDHVGSNVSHSGGTLPYPLTSGSSGCTWFEESLDPSCPYKRAYVGYVAEEMAKNLLAAVSECELEIPDPGTVIEAIEIFNEVDDRDFWEDSTTSAPNLEASGERWGRAYLHAAWRFRQQLGDSVSLWLPGIASYHEQAVAGIVGREWEDKKAFVRGLILGIVNEANDFSTVVTGDPMVTTEVLLPQLPSLVQGIDLHWYHRESGEMRHIGYLVQEIKELRSTVVDQMNALIPDEPFGDDFSVSVFENGWGLGDQLPEGVVDPSASDKHEFQAWEVWRRIGGALAGNASISGWHSWMSNNSGGFVGMGLREDGGSSGDPASDSLPRDAWYAYAALTNVLGGRVYNGRMVLPAISGRADLSTPPSGMTTRSMGMVVFEYQLTPTTSATLGPWAYMVLRDPTVEQPTMYIDYLLKATPINAYSGGTIKVYEGLVMSVLGSYTGGSTTELPGGEVAAVSTSIPMSTFAVFPTWKPKLYVSSHRLSWSLVSGVRLSGGVTVSPAVGRMYAVPAWMDNPGQPVPTNRRPATWKGE